jgi:hypothetical protein
MTPSEDPGKEEKDWALALILAAVYALIFWPNPAQADERDWVSVTLASYHAERDRGYNEINYGAGIESALPWDKWRVAGGFYRNSYYRTTWYALGVREIWTAGRWKLGVALGGATGYTRGRINLVAAPIAAWEGDRYGITVFPLTPKVIGLQVKMRF